MSRDVDARKAPRAVSCSCPVRLQHEELVVLGTVQDLSLLGLGVSVRKAEGLAELPVDSEFDAQMQTPYGLANFRVALTRIVIQEDGAFLGLKLLDHIADEEDTLWKFANAGRLKHWYWRITANSEQPGEGDERRAFARAIMQTSCHVELVVGSVTLQGEVIDLSENGMGVLCAACVSVASNEVADFSVDTPYGISRGKARVAWSRPEDGGTRIGCEFTEVSEDKQDPLQLYIQSPF